MKDGALVSIVILAWNEIAYTRECLDSLARRTAYPHELVLVDNGSTDGTGEYFTSIPGATVLRNEVNLGFPRGVNQGIRAAKGDLVCLLNNDTVLTPNWLDNLVTCARSDPRVGLVGPRSNYVAGPQVLPVNYQSVQEMLGFATEFNRPDPRRWFDQDTLVGFCLLIKREVINKIGLFDEQFGVGNFEDNDYCLRARQAGFRLVCAGDTFVHHYGSRSFTGNKVDYRQLMQENRIRFEFKWRAGATSTQEVSLSSLSIARVKATLGAVKARLAPPEDPVETYAAPVLLQDVWSNPALEAGPLPRLSACIVAGEQNEDLPLTLASLQGLADETVVATAALPERLAYLSGVAGIRLETAAVDALDLRNRAIGAATHDWILLLEAGEVLSKEHINRLRKALINPGDNVGYYLNLFAPIGLRRGNQAVMTYTLRLFRRHPGLQVTGWLDDDLLTDLVRDGGTVKTTPISLKHRGYLKPARGTRRAALREAEGWLGKLLEAPGDNLMHFRAGGALARYGQREAAVEEFRRAFAGIPSLEVAFAAPLLLNLSTVLADLGQTDEACSIAEQGIDAYPGHPDLQLLVARLKQRQRRYWEAAELVLEASRPRKKDPVYVCAPETVTTGVRLALADLYEQYARPAEAVKTLVEELKARPDSVGAATRLARLLLNDEPPDRVADFLANMVDACSPNVAEALAQAFMARGHLKQALEGLDKAIKPPGGGPLDPQVASLVTRKGRLLTCLGRHAEAEGILTAVVAGVGQAVDPLLARGLCRLLAGRSDDARGDFSFVLEQGDPEQQERAGVYLRLIQLLGGPTEESTAAAKEAASPSAWGEVLWMLEVFLHLADASRLGAALKLWNQVAPAAVKNLALGKLYYRLGLPDSASQTLQAAGQEGDLDLEGTLALAQLFETHGDLQKASALYLQATDMALPDLQPYLTLAALMERRGDRESAQRILNRARELFGAVGMQPTRIGGESGAG